MHALRILRGGTRARLSATPGDLVFEGLSTLVALSVVGLLVVITVILYLVAQESIRVNGLRFLTDTIWDSVSQRFGAAPFIYGMLVTSGIALLLGVPVSLGIAIFLSELAPPWLRIPLTFIVELLAAVPSVVYGLWGIFVLGPAMRIYIEPGVQSVLGFLPLFQGRPIGSDVFTAGVILAIMIIPTISAVSREALLAVPDSQREAALSLGATRWETTRLAVLRYARAGIFGASILGLGRAVGETMAVTMTIGNRAAFFGSLFEPGQTIASQIAGRWLDASTPLELGALVELGLILMLVSLIINAFARLLVGRFLRVGEGAE
ncbi:MAG: phosphate ABC transporter permease subunit PstC [Methanobacteriota archaeon]|nr:MAG: phosphate ABC transporter permease subunit PstC [Euryarchaeota archaeon]